MLEARHIAHSKHLFLYNQSARGLHTCMACIRYIARWFQGSCTYWMRQGYVYTYAKPSSLWQHRPPKYYGVPKDEAIISPPWTWFYGINTMEDTVKNVLRRMDREQPNCTKSPERNWHWHWRTMSITSPLLAIQQLNHKLNLSVTWYPFHLWATQHTQWCWRKKGVENWKFISYQLQKKSYCNRCCQKVLSHITGEVSQNNLLRDAHGSQNYQRNRFSRLGQI